MSHQTGRPGFSDLGYARVDTDRARRQGLPEVVYGPGKKPEQIAGIVRELLGANTGPVLVTRVEAEAAEAVLGQVAAVHDDVAGQYDTAARLLTWRATSVASDWRIAVVSAGTSDQKVAAEAAAISEAIGFRITQIQDVGVAGLHRLMDALPQIELADLIIVVAGMEGALASVLGGLVSVPVIAVPTSAGYGSSFEGATALLAMTASCASGVTVVNIDGGFNAAMAAHRMLTSLQRRATQPWEIHREAAE